MKKWPPLPCNLSKYWQTMLNRAKWITPILYNGLFLTSLFSLLSLHLRKNFIDLFLHYDKVKSVSEYEGLNQDNNFLWTFSLF